MATRFVRPETTRLTISDGDTLTVRTQLSAGEQRARFARMSQPGPSGQLQLNRLQVGLATILAYLLDWSLSGEDGQRVEIRHVSADELAATLDSLDPDSFAEILKAIETHEATQQSAREGASPFRASALSVT